MSFAASAVIIAYGYLRLKLFDLVPIALDILIERIPDAMFVLDPAGHIIDANPAAERLVATFKGHLVGRHLCNVFRVIWQIVNCVQEYHPPLCNMWYSIAILVLTH